MRFCSFCPPCVREGEHLEAYVVLSTPRPNIGIELWRWLKQWGYDGPKDVDVPSLRQPHMNACIQRLFHCFRQVAVGSGGEKLDGPLFRYSRRLSSLPVRRQ